MKKLPVTEIPEEPFGPVIYTYTRAQAIADAAQVSLFSNLQPARP